LTFAGSNTNSARHRLGDLKLKLFSNDSPHLTAPRDDDRNPSFKTTLNVTDSKESYHQT
jgi:hypothetical protein